MIKSKVEKWYEVKTRTNPKATSKKWSAFRQPETNKITKIMEYYNYFSPKFWQLLWGLWQEAGLEISTSIVLFLLWWLILSTLVTYILWRKRPKTPHFWRKHLLLNSIICLPLSLFINLGYIVMRFIMPARNQAASYGQLTLHPLEKTFVTLFNVIYSYEWLFLVSAVVTVNVLLLTIWRKKIFKQSTLS